MRLVRIPGGIFSSIRAWAVVALDRVGIPLWPGGGPGAPRRRCAPRCAGARRRRWGSWTRLVWAAPRARRGGRGCVEVRAPRRRRWRSGVGVSAGAGTAGAGSEHKRGCRRDGDPSTGPAATSGAASWRGASVLVGRSGAGRVLAAADPRRGADELAAPLPQGCFRCHSSAVGGGRLLGVRGGRSAGVALWGPGPPNSRCGRVVTGPCSIRFPQVLSQVTAQNSRHMATCRHARHSHGRCDAAGGHTAAGSVPQGTPARRFAATARQRGPRHNCDITVT